MNRRGHWLPNNALNWVLNFLRKRIHIVFLCLQVLVVSKAAGEELAKTEESGCSVSVLSPADTGSADTESCIGKCFATVRDALSYLRKTNCSSSLISLGKGLYREKIVLDLPGLTLVGRGRDQSYIVHALPAGVAAGYDRDGWGTPGSATVTINASDVVVRDLTIENDFDFLHNDGLEKNHPQREANAQAVALLLDSKSDRILLQGVKLASHQDTLFARGKRAIVIDSVVTGSVDFIFGSGQVWFENSELISRKRGKAISPGALSGYISAPSTQLRDSYGFVFNHCIVGAEKGVPDGSVALGRPWHPTRNFSDGRYADPDAVGFALFANSVFGAHISTLGWSAMRGTNKDGKKTLVFTPESARFFELNNRGPGVHTRRQHKKEFILENGDSVKASMLDTLRHYHVADWADGKKVLEAGSARLE
ncbi:pectinesterase family protein [Teredinibacter turnerae]|uniref:pectinesterase family protein n=1 Tax=Teredinibacter turnerae TaxID=2426 RepID=UPI00035E1B1A|nr:pectinesterase family protein [Teredinibacter turnerae]